MAPQRSTNNGPTKKRRNRKARTEVSSSSETSSSDSSDSDATPNIKTSKKSKPTTSSTQSAAGSQASFSPSPSPSPAAATAKIASPNAEQAFQSFYLKQATRELGEDLEKLRSASDWKGQRSVDVLVRALGQGGATFSAEERAAIGRAGEAEG